MSMNLKTLADFRRALKEVTHINMTENTVAIIPSVLGLRKIVEV